MERDNDFNEILHCIDVQGTTWVQEIVHMLTHGCKKTNENSEVLETRFPYLEYPYPGIKSLATRKEKRFIKTHLPISLLPSSFESSNAKVRVLVSIKHCFLLTNQR